MSECKVTTKRSYLNTQKGIDYSFWNTSIAEDIAIFSDTNGLQNVLLYPRSGVRLRADGNMQAMTYSGEATLLVDKMDVDTEGVMMLTGKSFYLDAGHGGKDPGAVNATLGLQEKIAALEVILKLGTLLTRRNAIVYYSREDDSYPTINERAAEANKLNVTAFISVHLNSADSTTANGVETLCYSMGGTAGKLAQAVQTELVIATGFRNRGVKTRTDLGVLKNTKMPAILCELGFISNNAEAQWLFNENNQESVARAIRNGILEIYGQ